MDHIDARPRDPAEAFDEMRGELALLRRAIEGLTAEKEKTPDYSETLGTMDGRLKRIAHNIAFIAERPAMELTPDVIAAQTGSTIADSSRPLATSRLPKPRSVTTPCWTTHPWPHNLNRMTSGKPGAVQSEPVKVQAFIPERPVERLDIGIVRGLSGPGEVDPDAMVIGP